MNKTNYIAGEWVGASSKTISINPSDTEDQVGVFSQGTASDVEQAALAALSAFKSWSISGIQQRHDILKKAGDLIAQRKEELGDLLAREEGKTLAEGIGEVTRAAQIFYFFAGECLRLAGELLPSVRPGLQVEITREPVGVIGIITPWNFPIAIPAWKIAPALAYGNCVVFKPAELVPAMAHKLMEILVEAGVPAGVVNLVNGSGKEVGQAIVDHPAISAVSFTGSQSTGNSLAQQCVAQGKKVQLEMGGKNPFVILDDADLDTAVDCAINSAFYSTGQRCTASSRLVVTAGIHDAFIERMQEGLRVLRVGDARAAGTHMGPVVDNSQLAKNLHYIDIGKKEGAELLFGGQRLELERPGYYMSPALFIGANDQMRVVQEEIFGPVATVQKAQDYEEALKLANDTPFGLASGICTNSLHYVQDFKRRAEAGMVMVNLPTAGVDYHVPFGGRKSSSYGPREQGSYAAEFYTTVKTSYTKTII